MLKIAIIGCGKIADQHVEQIAYIPHCRIVGVCDREELMARQLRERLNTGEYFTEVKTLLDKTKPDIVHITTPPQTHFSIGKECLEAGSHIYIEKPFTVFFDEAEELIRIAERLNLKVTVGHNAQFSQAAIQTRELVASGYLGGAPLHMESYYCYDLGDAAYAKALFGDPHHWVRGLPGGLLQNTISHGISKVAEFLSGESPEVIAHGFTSPLLNSVGETNICDELRVIIHEGAVTAYFTFSSQMRPSLHLIRMYGATNGLILDEQHQSVIKLPGKRYKSYLDQFLPPWSYAKQYMGSSLRNMRKFLQAEFHEGHGMKVLIESFYRSVADGAPVPIPHCEILRTSYIMDSIFSQLKSSRGMIEAHRSASNSLQHKG